MFVTLDDVCEKGSSNLAQKDILDLDGDFPIFGAAGYIGNVNFYHQEKPYLAVVKDGAGVGRVMLLPAKSSVIGTMQYIIPKEGIIVEYLYYAVKAMHLEKYYMGAAIPHIYFKDYKKEKLMLCSKIKQEQIVARLDIIEKIINQHKQQLKNLEKFTKARFVEVFGDPVLNSMKWEEHKLSEYILFMTSGSRGWSKYFTGDGSEVFITIKNVKNNKITLKEIQFVNAPDDKEAKRTKVQAGDLLISITADLGRTGVVSNEIAKQGAYINQHLSLIRLDVSKINPHFVSYYLETEAGKRQFASKNQSAVKAGLSFESIRSLKILVPPMEVQRDYVLFVEQVDKSKSVIEKSLKELETLQASLMQKYFS